MPLPEIQPLTQQVSQSSPTWITGKEWFISVIIPIASALIQAAITWLAVKRTSQMSLDNSYKINKHLLKYTKQAEALEKTVSDIRHRINALLEVKSKLISYLYATNTDNLEEFKLALNQAFLINNNIDESYLIYLPKEARIRYSIILNLSGDLLSQLTMVQFQSSLRVKENLIGTNKEGEKLITEANSIIRDINDNFEELVKGLANNLELLKQT